MSQFEAFKQMVETQLEGDWVFEEFNSPLKGLTFEARRDSPRMTIDAEPADDQDGIREFVVFVDTSATFDDIIKRRSKPSDQQTLCQQLTFIGKGETLSRALDKLQFPGACRVVDYL